MSDQQQIKPDTPSGTRRRMGRRYRNKIHAERQMVVLKRTLSDVMEENRALEKQVAVIVAQSERMLQLVSQYAAEKNGAMSLTRLAIGLLVVLVLIIVIIKMVK